MTPLSPSSCIPEGVSALSVLWSTQRLLIALACLLVHLVMIEQFPSGGRTDRPIGGQHWLQARTRAQKSRSKKSEKQRLFITFRLSSTKAMNSSSVSPHKPRKKPAQSAASLELTTSAKRFIPICHRLPSFKSHAHEGRRRRMAREMGRKKKINLDWAACLWAQGLITRTKIRQVHNRTLLLKSSTYRDRVFGLLVGSRQQRGGGGGRRRRGRRRGRAAVL